MRSVGLLTASTALIAATYGLVRLAYGLFLPDVQAELLFDAAVAGFISSGASIVYCLGAVLGFFVASRRPRLLVLLAGLSAGLGAAGMASSEDTGIFAIFAVLSSAGAGLASPALVTLIRRNVVAADNDRSQTIVNAGTGPGLAAAGIVALVLLPDWRLAWFLVAAATLAIAAVVLVLDRQRAQHPDPAGEVHPVGIPSGSWLASHRQIIAAAFFMGAGSAAVWNYGRTLLVEGGADERASIAAWIALGIGGTVAIGTARPMSALEPRTAWTMTTLAIAAASIALALAPGSTGAALAACAVFGWGYTSGTGALITWTTRIDGARASAGTSLLFLILVFGQAFGASAVGLLISQAGLVVAFLAASALVLLATATPLLWKKHQSELIRPTHDFGGAADTQCRFTHASTRRG